MGGVSFTGMDDIIIPRGAPDEFFPLLEKLGTKKAVFFLGKIPQDKPKDMDVGAVTDNPLAISKAKAKGLPVVSTSNEVKVLEAGPTVLIEAEGLYKRDPMHFRASGLNHILCKLMAKKGIMYGTSFSLLLNAEGKNRAKLLGRAKQNIMLCRQYGVPVKAFSCAREPHELRDRKDLDRFLDTL